MNIDKALLVMRVFAVASLILMVLALSFIGTLTGASLFGESVTPKEQTASNLFSLAGLSSVLLVFILIKFRKSTQVVLISTVLYIVCLLGLTVAASHFSKPASFEESTWKQWTSYSGIVFPLYVQILFTVALLAPIPLLTDLKQRQSAP